ncbi:MAG: ATP-binding protein [Vulcanimicrobiaceae bacterium]
MSANELAAPAITTKRSVLFTILLMCGVLLFTFALFGIVLTNVRSSIRSNAGLTATAVASRQAALAQEISRDLYQIGEERRAKAPLAQTQSDLITAASDFEATARAYVGGGTTVDPLTGKAVTIEKPSDPEAVAFAGRILANWETLKAALGPIARGTPTLAELAEAEATAQATSSSLVGDANAFALRIQSDLAAELHRLDVLRSTLTALAVLCFVLIVGSLFARVSETQRQVGAYAEDLEHRNRELDRSARELYDAKTNSDLIMDTVNQGLFLIDGKFLIQGQYSRELEGILRMPNLAGFNFLNILQRLLTERMFNTSKDYLDLLFDVRRRERTVLKVNPLDEIEVNFPNPQGGFSSKFLNFSFRRIVEGGEIKRVFVAVSDITDRVQLERELRQSEAKKEKQFELLLGILHVEPRALDDFVSVALAQVHEMNDALRAQDFATANAGTMDLLRKRLDVVFRCVHSIKGHAALLKLEYFLKTCEEFERKISELKNRSALGGDDFLSIVIMQSDLRVDLDELQELRTRFLGISAGLVARAGGESPVPNALREINGASNGLAPNEPRCPLGNDVASLAQTLAERLGKPVRVEAAEFDSRGFPEEHRLMLKDVLIQLTRNAMTHGIEEGGLRDALRKPATAVITLKNVPGASDSFGFAFRDDGAGLNPTKIKRRAVEQGLLSEDEALHYRDADAAVLIFSDGFSTAGDVSVDAGRGMGMSVIKHNIVDRLGGEIFIDSEPGKFTQFTFLVPRVAAGQLVRQ